MLAYSFYVAYGKKGGFDVRKGGQYKAAGGKETTIKYFYCSREGLPVKGKSVDKNSNEDMVEDGESSNGSIKFGEFKNKQKRRKASFRCGCLASLTLNKVGNVYEVKKLEEGHNHPLILSLMNSWLVASIEWCLQESDCKNNKKKLGVYGESEMLPDGC
ncbi:protein FAR1-RELATED SEQUENCE 5 [Artemisia annua]|uniref:Protein FAR1-RELATED SEQUENCE 5 n=1 Tax=Artemisia annua TaxID=35608 RepID=A0A2U1KI15_ARTAN|nr:protein FAR1-RELATED SEQUENCE 5 [Artemisia annua]